MSWYRRRIELAPLVLQTVGVDIGLWQIMKEKIHEDDLRTIAATLCPDLEEFEAMELLTEVAYEPCEDPGPGPSGGSN